MDKFDGYISKVSIGGKLYKLQCEVVEVYPMTCSKCGAPVELIYGRGQCLYCGTHYTTNFSIQEVKDDDR